MYYPTELEVRESKIKVLTEFSLRHKVKDWFQSFLHDIWMTLFAHIVSSQLDLSFCSDFLFYIRAHHIPLVFSLITSFSLNRLQRLSSK